MGRGETGWGLTTLKVFAEKGYKDSAREILFLLKPIAVHPVTTQCGHNFFQFLKAVGLGDV